MVKNSYDQEFKDRVLDDYFNNGLSYKKIAEKYNMPVATVKKRMQNFKKKNAIENTKDNSENIALLDITPEIKSSIAEKATDDFLYSIQINGTLIRVNKITLKVIIEALKND